MNKEFEMETEKMLMADRHRHRDEDLHKRTDHIFLIYYLALIAIIEGVTFALLMDKGFALVSHKDANAHREWAPFFSQVPYLLTSLLVIIFTTYQYSLMLLCFNWKLRVSDTVFPFTIGLFQAAQVHFLDHAFTWWLLFLLLCSTGATSLILNKNLFQRSLVLSIPPKIVKKTTGGIFFVLVSSVLISAVAAYNSYPKEDNNIFHNFSYYALGIVAGSIIYSLVKMSRLKLYLYKPFIVSEPPVKMQTEKSSQAVTEKEILTEKLAERATEFKNHFSEKKEKKVKPE